MTTITTRNELDALAVGTVMSCRDGLRITKVRENEYDVEGLPLPVGPCEIAGEYNEDGESTFFPIKVNHRTVRMTRLRVSPEWHTDYRPMAEATFRKYHEYFGLDGADGDEETRTVTYWYTAKV